MPSSPAPLAASRPAPRRRLAPVFLAAAFPPRRGGLRAGAPAPGPRWQHIKTALFFTSEDVKQLLAKPEDRRATLAYFAPLRLTKVYLDNASVDPAAVASLREIAADLRAQGLEVSGAVVPSNRGPLCYNNPDDMALLEGRVRVLAQVFDEIIVDDWLFTTCTCAKCLEGRGSDSWADYRSRLVAEQSKRHLIDAAKPRGSRSPAPSSRPTAARSATTTRMTWPCLRAGCGRWPRCSTRSSSTTGSSRPAPAGNAWRAAAATPGPTTAAGS